MVRITHPPGGVQQFDAAAETVPKTGRVLKPPGGVSSISFGYDEPPQQHIPKKTSTTTSPMATETSEPAAPVAETSPVASPSKDDCAAEAKSEAPAAEASNGTSDSSHQVEVTEASSASVQQAETSSSTVQLTEANSVSVEQTEAVAIVEKESIVVESVVKEEATTEVSSEIVEVAETNVQNTSEVCIEKVSDNLEKASISNGSNGTTNGSTTTTNGSTNGSSDVKSNGHNSPEVQVTATPSTPEPMSNTSSPVECISPKTAEDPKPDTTKTRVCGSTNNGATSPQPQTTTRATPANHHMRSSIFTGSDDEPYYPVASKGRSFGRNARTEEPTPPAPKQQPPHRVRQPPGGFSSQLW